MCDVNVLPKLTNGDALASSSSYLFLVVRCRCRWLRQHSPSLRVVCTSYASVSLRVFFFCSVLFCFCFYLWAASSDSLFRSCTSIMRNVRARTERFMGGRQNQYTVIKKRCTIRAFYLFVFFSVASSWSCTYISMHTTIEYNLYHISLIVQWMCVPGCAMCTVCASMTFIHFARRILFEHQMLIQFWMRSLLHAHVQNEK